MEFTKCCPNTILNAVQLFSLLIEYSQVYSFTTVPLVLSRILSIPYRILIILDFSHLTVWTCSSELLLRRKDLILMLRRGYSKTISSSNMTSSLGVSWWSQKTRTDGFQKHFRLRWNGRIQFKTSKQKRTTIFMLGLTSTLCVWLVVAISVWITLSMISKKKYARVQTSVFL